MATKSVLNGTVATAPPGQMGFDADEPISADAAAAFAAEGFVFCLRYLSRSTPNAAGDLSAAEAAGILGAGLALMPVQHVSRAGWIPSVAIGQQYGAAAVANAQAVGFPPGVNVWVDLEGVAPGTPADAAIGFCNAWFQVVSAAGYLPGLYVGHAHVLDSEQLFWDLKCKSYWRAGGETADVDQRGYQMVQRIPGGKIADIGYDLDVTRNDALGGAVTWLAPMTAAVRRGARTVRPGKTAKRAARKAAKTTASKVRRRG
ncbi:MAG TPA: glycoside hydrolase domain-containing protein [Burkholderiaceae bacterium]|nr:glycoside hydrolase domain-containing protein [Burkholderiaceae bacterium]